MADATPSESKYPPSSDAEMRRAKPFMRVAAFVNTLIFRLSGGRIGNKFPGGGPVGLLTMTGRKTGKRRTIPLVYGQMGAQVTLIASQGGMPAHPLWYHNLVTEPEVEFQIGNEKRTYLAREVEGAEKSLAWKAATERHSDFDEYQKRTDRVIPVFVLDPR